MFTWVQNANRARYAIDALLLVLMIVAAAQKATGNLIHEWISLLFIIPFAVHLVQHWEWITRIPKRFFGKLNIQSRINVILNIALYLLMLWVIVSGLMTSKEALPLLGFDVGRDGFWKQMHKLGADGLLIILGIHMAMHWSWIVKMTKKIFSRRKTSRPLKPAAAGDAQ